MIAHTVPVLLLVLLGVWLRRAPRTPEGFFPAIEWFTFYVAFPALLFVNTAQLDVSGAQLRDLTAATLLPTLLFAAAVALVLPLARGLPDASRSSVIQGATRPSTYFGLSVAALVFERETAALVMLALAICLPAVNVIAVVALTRWSGRPAGPGRIARALAGNPIIVATAAGAAVNLSGLPLPGALVHALDILGAAALALGLVCVGGGLVFDWSASRPAALAATSALKLLALPLVAVSACRLLGASEAVTAASCFYAALPTASNAYIMARQMGGDAPLMAALITLQTLLAVVTVPLAMRLPAWFAG
ncbi:AEC family transporter [Luteimonas sp. FCS-9]|uniref:AEC family transporter n=1 Tax=Luteimonas sp. FCS-9 TaxID=1547516 RepID=UPI0009E54628|nr:AEC family transporter [Luteimonas sp. FCS-9]